MTQPTLSLRDELSSALDWWREAGVDTVFTDDATVWLREPGEEEAAVEVDPPAESPSLLTREPAKASEVAANAAAAPIDFFAQGKPETLEEFREFWLTAPDLDPIGLTGRVPPRGAQSADLMVLVVDPEQRDTDALLSGPQGRLLKSILDATGVSTDRAYVASALPRHTPMADSAALAGRGLGAVLHHHISLVAPKQLIAFGSGLAPFFDAYLNQTTTDSRQVQGLAPLPAPFMCEGLDGLISMPSLKARFWRRWMEWTATKD
ncbi:MAG: hypothetical protein AAF553_02280 [Pseudomonadota bacterium]